MTEAEARAALVAFDGVGDVERWIADRPWQAVPGGWVVPEPFEGWRLNLEITYGGLRIVASDGWASRRSGSCRLGGRARARRRDPAGGVPDYVLPPIAGARSSWLLS